MSSAGEINLALLAPELTIGIVALVAIALDFVLEERQKPLLAYLAVAAIAVTAVLVVTSYGPSTVGFFGTWVVDPIASYFKLVILLAAAVVTLSSIDYVRHRTKYQGEFYATLLLATLGMMLMASARELITLYLALELTSISLYILAGFLKTEVASSEAGMKYLILGAVSSAALLYGMALTFGMTGTTLLPDIAAQIAATNAVASPVLLLALVLIAAGFGFKVAAVPFHMWAPDVYHGAPTPVTAFLSVASKAAGFVILLRVFAVAFSSLSDIWTGLFAVLAAITMTVGNVGALRQTNVKRLMGYSTIAQAGYALMALAVAGAEATGALLFFLVAYAATNLATFAVIIHFSNRLGSDELHDYAGLSRRAPIMSFALLLGLLSLVGMPPLAGFWSKVYLFFAVFNAGLLWLVIIGLLNSALSAYYYLKVIHALYLRPTTDEHRIASDPPLVAALIASVAAIVLLGLAPNPFLEAATNAAAEFFAR